MTSVSNILVVDDDDESREATALILNAGGFEDVVMARSAEDAYALLDLAADDEDEPPRFDVILLDIMMPEIDGIEACARIRTTRRYRDIPILMVSGMRNVESLNQAFVAGAHDYITKPINRMELLARVRSALRLKRELDRRRARESELRSDNRELRLTSAPDYFDEVTKLPSRSAFQLLVQIAADADRPCGLIALLVDELGLYRSEMGDDATHALIVSASTAVSAVAAPLNWALCSYGDGLFLILAPGADRDAMERIADAARANIAALHLPHGNSAERDEVRLRAMAAGAQGTALLGLPATLISAIEARRGDAWFDFLETKI